METKINRVTHSRLIPVLTLLLTLCFSAPAQSVPAIPPDLVLIVVVDQLRGDMPGRFGGRFGPGGFRYVMEQGIEYRNTRYQHANTMTAAGHATLATGGNAAQHGMIANDWYDAEKHRLMNCVEDERVAILGEAPGAKRGRSPRNLSSSTFGDELILASGGRSRVFAVSIKDRAAIILGGHLGKAWWYSKTSGNFVTSSYYQAASPEWAQRWNAEHPADRFANTSWDLLLGRDSYVFGDQDDRPYEQPDGTLGRTFPHRLPQRAGQPLYGILRSTPMGDELTLSFVEALVAAEQPGRRGSTDVLAVSFSATDYIGHSFGPDSLEAEDNLLRIDRTLAQLFQLIDRAVGLDKTLVVLASDHGTSPIPESLAARGMEAGRLDAPAFMQQIDSALKSRFGLQENLELVFAKPGIYFDVEIAKRLGLAVAEVERVVADELQKVAGVGFALTRSDLLMGRAPQAREVERVAAAFHPVRSGNVIMVQDPFWYLDATPDGNAAMHGSPHAYDTHVPLMFAGPGVPHGKVFREVAPRDVAPTISAYLGINPPSGSVGEPLVEVLQ